MKRTMILLALVLGSCSESHGTPHPMCQVQYSDDLTHWWIHYDTEDGACVYAEILDARDAELFLIRSLDQQGPYGVSAFVRSAEPCDVERLLPPSGNSRVATGWVRTRDVGGRPDVQMEVDVDFPAYPENGTPAITDHVEISGTESTPSGLCSR